MDEQLILQKDNITLKQLGLDDVPVLFALTDKNRAHLREWLPWLDHTTQESDTLKFIEGTIESTQKEKGLNFGIWVDSTLAGVISFNSISKSNRSADIGYWLGEEFEGKGIMSQSCTLLIQYGYDHLKLHRIQILCAAENTKSCKIPVRLGFTQEGIVREAEWLYDHFVSHNVYGLLESEWRIN